MKDRRLYLRILYQAVASITQKNKSWITEVIDLSLKGALLKLPAGWDTSQNKFYDATFQLNDSMIEIHLRLKLVQEDKKHLHFSIEHIDIESVSHLKRLVLLNVGDEAFLYRELAHLAASK